VVKECIELSGGWRAKIVPRGGGWVFGHVFPIHCKTAKNFCKCLIFNGLTLCSGFVVAEKSLSLNALQTSRKYLIFNGFTHFCGAGVGGSRVGVLSKG